MKLFIFILISVCLSKSAYAQETKVTTDLSDIWLSFSRKL